jgi:hypothetical protein
MNEIFKTRKQKESKRCSNRKMKQHKVPDAGYIFCFLAKAVPVTPFSVLCKQEQLSFRGLQVAEKNTSTGSVVAALQNMVRNGKKEARAILQNLVPVVCMHDVYPMGMDLYLAGSLPVTLHIASFPDLYVLLMQSALVSKTAVSDEVINFVRSSIPFFNNCRRTHCCNGWLESNGNSLRMILLCCVPSLLSLYTNPDTKDVSFFARVQIFKFMSALFAGKHAEQVAFFHANKSLLRICFAEYAHDYIQRVQPKFLHRFVPAAVLQQMITSSGNMGQELRLELNEAFAKAMPSDPSALDDDAGNAVVTKALAQISNVCQVLHERSLRLYKNVSAPCTSDPRVAKDSVGVGKMTEHKKETYLAAMQYLDRAPYTDNFCIFESLCCRRGVPTVHIAVLWDIQKIIRVFPVSPSICRQQMQAIQSNGIFGRDNIIRASTMVVCVICTMECMFPQFRRDFCKNRYTCTRCRQEDTCVKINLLGRCAVLGGVPLALSTCCSNVVVLSGTGFELTSSSCSSHHVCWSRQTNCSHFRSKLFSVIYMQFLLNSRTVCQPATLPVVCRHYVRERMQGNQDPHLQILPEKTCVLCRSCSIQQAYVLFDIYSECSVLVRTCYQHSFSHKWNKDNVHTLQQYLTIFKFIEATSSAKRIKL